jgi:hypothetical protein
MTQPFNPAGDGLPAGPAPDTTAAGSCTVGGTGPGVPLSIWPGLPAPRIRDGEPCGGPITAAAARRVIDAFSHPGDLVAADGGSLAVTEAAAAAGRRVLTLTPGAALARQRPGVPAALPPPGDPAAGTARLAVAGWCGPGCCGSQPGSENEQDPGLVFAASERVLRPGGILAVITGPAAPGSPAAGTAGSIVAAARAAGLVYAQHIVLVRAAIDGERLTPTVPDPAAAGPGGTPVHDDLLVFTKPGAGACL